MGIVTGASFCVASFFSGIMGRHVTDLAVSGEGISLDVKNSAAARHAWGVSDLFRAWHAHDGRVVLVYPDFPLGAFRRGLEKALEPLELKQRMHLLADRLEACLPTHPPELFRILVKTLATDEADQDGLRGFLVWPLTEIVARRGLGHFEDSMQSFREMTRCFTAEFAIRVFLREHPERTLKQLHAWCGDPDADVRRLVSEGSRPLLPWGGNLPQLLEPPHPTLELLEKLRNDPSDYVRLSVSNHLNDFSKHHPDLVIETLARWLKADPGDAGG
jgi:3-methyladenine DNA glycosylase AlkC